ncbi:hypothetical protein C8Z91_11355 [Paenibacillus elgii]|uniref:DUF1002 domain-containing protein n=1 Tax=Paenibacillus elgii TaxID=189691 RepID=A0A2T6G4K0_9BACL|nr:hypothetical protein [Paenibacillus elgii]PUA39062.1 hypothetical protein C8Z91_11355 [Paenibacillus elgii]
MVLKLKQNVVAFGLAASLLATSLIPTGQAFASNTETAVPQKQYVAVGSNSYANAKSEVVVTPEGVKVKAVEIAIKALDKVITSPVTRWALEKIFDKETVDLVISKSGKIFSVFDEFVYAFELTVEEIAAAAKSRIIQELGDTVGKGAAQMIGQVVEWLIKYGSKILF